MAEQQLGVEAGFNDTRGRKPSLGPREGGGDGERSAAQAGCLSFSAW